jgi:hypothetical protein
VASNGLIEKVRTNLVLQSQAFNTTWGNNLSPTITANTTVAPDGTTTADTIAASANTSGVFQVLTVSSGVEYSFSVYLKNVSGATNINLGNEAFPSNANLSFNAATGAIISTGAGLTSSSVTDAGNGWYRVSGTYTSTGINAAFVIYGTGVMSFAAWGAQLETGVTTAYIPTTSAAVSVGPVSGLPRLDYLNSTCPRLLLEPQRTNLAQYSEQFNNAAWNKDPATTTITANNAVSPDGYTNADLFGSSSPSAEAGVYQTILGLTPAATYYISAYVKLGTATNVCITVNNTVAWNTVGGQSFSAANGLNTNTWTRVGFTFTAPAGANINYHIGQHQQTGVNPQSLGTFLVWGAQVEAGAYATSYIPTLGTSVTRVADAASKTGISSLIGQTEGTLFFECSNKALLVNARYFSVSDGTGSNRIDIYQADATNLGIFVGTGGAAQVNVTNVTLPASGAFKFALAYANNDYVWYVNGTQIGTDTSASVPATSAALLGVAADLTASAGNSPFSQALLFKTRLTNAQLAELTTL